MMMSGLAAWINAQTSTIVASPLETLSKPAFFRRPHAIRLASLLQISVVTFYVIATGSALASSCQVKNLAGIEIDRDTAIDLSFTEISPRYYQIRLTQHTRVDDSARIAEYRSTVQAQLPDDSCGTEISLRNTSQSLEGAAWKLSSSVRTKRYFCLKTDGTCCKWKKWYPECRKCTWTIREDDLGFRKSLNLDTRFVPSIAREPPEGEPSYSVKVVAHTKLEDLKDWEKVLQDGLKLVADLIKIGTFTLVDFSKQLSVSLPSTPAYEVLREKLPTISNFRPVPTSTEFVNGGPFPLSLRVTSADKRKCSVAEEIYYYFSNRESWSSQTQDGAKTYTVRRGDSLWAIALREYGDGRYYLPLATYNRKHIRGQISEGEKIEIPTLARLEKTGPIVSRGDSLWAMADGKQERFTLLKRSFETFGRNPNQIYPLDLILEREPANSATSKRIAR